jgi:hypothetical protein
VCSRRLAQYSNCVVVEDACGESKQTPEDIEALLPPAIDDLARERGLDARWIPPFRRPRSNRVRSLEPRLELGARDVIPQRPDIRARVTVIPLEGICGART